MLAGLALYGAEHAAVLNAALGCTAAGMLITVPIHVAGALTKSQPAFETREIPIYLGLGLFFSWLLAT